MEDQYIFNSYINTKNLWKGKFNEVKQFEWENASFKDLKLKLPKKIVFGKLMELCFKNQIENRSKFEILLNNHQIIKDKITLGELDFILQNKISRKIFHIEMVFKFYLYDESRIETQNFEAWIGPNRRDSFKKKLEKLKTKQFPLLYSKVTVSNLLQYNIEVNKIKQRVLFKAQLYVPVNKLNSSFRNINSECIVGTWMTKADFLNEATKGNTYYLPQKRLWHVPPFNNISYQAFSPSLKYIENLHQEKRSPLVWVKNPSGKLQRMFVVFW